MGGFGGLGVKYFADECERVENAYRSEIRRLPVSTAEEGEAAHAVALSRALRDIDGIRSQALAERADFLSWAHQQMNGFVGRTFRGTRDEYLAEAAASAQWYDELTLMIDQTVAAWRSESNA